VTSATPRGRATRPRVRARTPLLRTARPAAMGTLVPRRTLARTAPAPGPIRSRAPRATSVTSPALATRAPERARIPRPRTGRLATTGMRARRPTAVRAAPVPARIPSPAPPKISAMSPVLAIPATAAVRREGSRRSITAGRSGVTKQPIASYRRNALALPSKKEHGPIWHGPYFVQVSVLPVWGPPEQGAPRPYP
jgi:hypothetical protein